MPEDIAVIKENPTKTLEYLSTLELIEGNHVFGQLKQNFEIDQKVIIGRTTDENLDGQTGTIVGKSFNNICDFYIVLLDIPYPDGTKAINMIESCLSPL